MTVKVAAQATQPLAQKALPIYTAKTVTAKGKYLHQQRGALPNFGVSSGEAPAPVKRQSKSQKFTISKGKQTIFRYTFQIFNEMVSDLTWY